VENIQQMLEAESFLSPRQIIEYMGEQFKVHDKYLDWEAFYNIIIGVYGKEANPIPWDELNEQRHELRKSGVHLSQFNGSDGFLADDFGMPPGKHLRFYLNAHDAAGRKQILESIVSEFRSSGGFKIKTVGTARNGFTRYDNTILYVGIDDAANYADFISGFSAEHAECFDDEVPLMTRKIGKGAGYAASTRKGVFHVLGNPLNSTNLSFSSVHSLVLQRTFDKAIKDNIEEYAVITDLYRQALTGARFDPEKPYLNSGMKDPLEIVAVDISRLS
jgi:hypothetical protein